MGGMSFDGRGNPDIYDLVSVPHFDPNFIF